MDLPILIIVVFWHFLFRFSKDVFMGCMSQDLVMLITDFCYIYLGFLRLYVHELYVFARFPVIFVVIVQLKLNKCRFLGVENIIKYLGFRLIKIGRCFLIEPLLHASL